MLLKIAIIGYHVYNNLKNISLVRKNVTFYINLENIWLQMIFE